MIKLNKSTIRVIAVMALISIIAILIARYYYKGKNAAEDPRVVEAKYLYRNYSGYIKNNQFENVLLCLDSIQNTYASVDHYRQSYEMGVVYTNKAALYLTIALYKDSLYASIGQLYPSFNLSVDSLFSIAKSFTKKSIGIYSKWIEQFSDLNDKEIRSLIADSFQKESFNCDKKTAQKYLEKRIEDIQLAQIETPRRLSVSYTNLGIVLRHERKYDQAIEYYKKAIELWDKNYTAKNNLNKLLNRPLEEPNLIEKIFPPERTKK